MNLTQKQATLVDRSAGACMLLSSPFVVVGIALRSRGIGQIKAAACTYDASWVHLRPLSTTSRKTTFATFGSTSYLAPEASDCSYDATATTTTCLATVAPGHPQAPNNYTSLQNLSLLDPNYDLKTLVYGFCKDSAGARFRPQRAMALSQEPPVVLSLDLLWAKLPLAKSHSVRLAHWELTLERTLEGFLGPSNG
jgi:hypothetical protein